MLKEIAKHHILITGTGRTGTTFLVQLLTLLDIDTGFTKDFLPVHKEANAGLEYQGLGGNLPYVLKNPKLMWQLPELIKSNPLVTIDHILLPIRELHAAAESRRENLKKAVDYDDPRKVIGGLEGVADPNEQESFFLEKFYKFFQFVSTYNIPLTTLQYPRLVLDGEYLFHKIGPLFSGIKKEHFMEVFAEVSNPSLVNKYTEGDRYELVYDDSPNIKQHYHANNNSNIPADVLKLRPELQQLRSNFLRKEEKLLELNTKNEELYQQKKEAENQLKASNVQNRQLANTLEQRDQIIAEQNTALAQKDTLITEKDQAITQINKELEILKAENTNINRQTGNFREELYSVYTSKSWRYTLSMRKVGTLVRRIVAFSHKSRPRAIIKQIYFMLPVSIRNSRLIDNLKNRFMRQEIQR